MFSRSEVLRKSWPAAGIAVRAFDTSSNDDFDSQATNPNLIVAEDLIKYKALLGNTLENAESITLDEL